MYVPQIPDNDYHDMKHKNPLTALLICLYLLQAYIIMENTFRKMGEVFDEIAQTEDQPPLVL